MKRVGQIYRSTMLDAVAAGLEKEVVFLVSYSRLSSFTISEMRQQLAQMGATVYVSKNSIAKIALESVKQNRLAEKVSEQTMFIWAQTDPVAVAKILVDFAKKEETFSVQGGILNQRFMDAQDITALSELPSREVLLATLLATMQAPVTRFMGALNAKSRDLLSILKQLSEKKGGS